MYVNSTAKENVCKTQTQYKAGRFKFFNCKYGITLNIGCQKSRHQVLPYVTALLCNFLQNIHEIIQHVWLSIRLNNLTAGQQIEKYVT